MYSESGAHRCLTDGYRLYFYCGLTPDFDKHLVHRIQIGSMTEEPVRSLTDGYLPDWIGAQGTLRNGNSRQTVQKSL